jgi:8-oxo-dGTP pyrophosphatase MutT (NUDIX family)
MQKATLCLIRQGEAVLLGWKKRGFGAGKLTGIGGRLEPNEAPTGCVCREVKEENGLIVAEPDLTLVADITFLFPHKPKWQMQVHVFSTERWVGVLQESEEIRGEWFMPAKIPYEKMWDDSKHWLPQVLDGKFIQTTFTYAEDNQTLINAPESNLV